MPSCHTIDVTVRGTGSRSSGIVARCDIICRSAGLGLTSQRRRCHNGCLGAFVLTVLMGRGHPGESGRARATSSPRYDLNLAGSNGDLPVFLLIPRKPERSCSAGLPALRGRTHAAPLHKSLLLPQSYPSPLHSSTRCVGHSPSTHPAHTPPIPTPSGDALTRPTSTTHPSATHPSATHPSSLNPTHPLTITITITITITSPSPTILPVLTPSYPSPSHLHTLTPTHTNHPPLTSTPSGHALPPHPSPTHPNSPPPNPTNPLTGFSQSCPSPRHPTPHLPAPTNPPSTHPILLH